jgi:hypothetical protein
MKYLLLMLLSLAATSESVFAKDRWLNNDQVLGCSPHTLREGETLTLKLGPNHGKELSVAREHDKTTFLLVVGSPPERFAPIMSTAEFSEAKQVQLSAALEATPWEPPFDKPKVRVFNRTGTYWLFVSNNLESEAPGYRCKVRFVQSRK